MVTASPQPIVMLVKPPCTISPGAPVPNSTTMATTPSPNRMSTNVPKNSAINSGNMLFIMAAGILPHSRRREQRDWLDGHDLPFFLSALQADFYVLAAAFHLANRPARVDFQEPIELGRLRLVVALLFRDIDRAGKLVIGRESVDVTLELVVVRHGVIEVIEKPDAVILAQSVGERAEQVDQLFMRAADERSCQGHEKGEIG